LPTSSSPLPYTTLFRSSRDARVAARTPRAAAAAGIRDRRLGRPLGGRSPDHGQPAECGTVAADQSQSISLGAGTRTAEQPRVTLDRKSTRLNSSHQIIS